MKICDICSDVIVKEHDSVVMLDNAPFLVDVKRVELINNHLCVRQDFHICNKCLKVLTSKFSKEIENV